MNNIIKDRLMKLRNEMKKYNIDAYYIPTEDFHGSEFVSDYFKEREYMSGFTGSAGTLIVVKDEAALFTDGRYFLQAEQELEGTGIILYKSGMAGVPDINKYLFESLESGMTIGFDGRCVTAQKAISINRYFKMRNKSVNFVGNRDLISDIWEDRPAMPEEKVYMLEKKYYGESTKVKLDRIRNWLEKRKTDVHILSSLDDIAWILNLRGNDVMFSPVFLSYMVITMESAVLYCGTGEEGDVKLREVHGYLRDNHIMVKKYSDIYNDINVFNKKDICAALDYDKINYNIYAGLKNCRIVNVINPSTLFKAVKNSCEIDNERKAHIKDAVAYIRFLFWFKNELKKDHVFIRETDLTDRLREERSRIEGYIEESFESIVAYGKNGAIVHYSPGDGHNAIIEKKSFVLIDTGGHYLEGTTDITRTLVCGDISEEEKVNYTLVLKGNIALGSAVFLEGITGANLDILARQFLWERALDYKHGTGHGVGYLLNVHEGPQNIRHTLGAGKNISCKYEEGMITSNEPGIYLTDKYGIRLENMMVCRKYAENEFGRFMNFETLTLVPFEREAIKVEMLTKKEKEVLNDYHKEVYDKTVVFLNDEERVFLKELTRPI